jgi:hypothetical protein
LARPGGAVHWQKEITRSVMHNTVQSNRSRDASRLGRTRLFVRGDDSCEDDGDSCEKDFLDTNLTGAVRGGTVAGPL